MFEQVIPTARLSLFGAGLMLAATSAAHSSCADHWTIPPDVVSQAFCDAVDAANAKGTVPVLRKPKCPRNGPSSKCNPSSMVFPEVDFTGLMTTHPDGSYSLIMLEAVNDPSLGANADWLGQLAESIYGDQAMVDASQFSTEGSEWRISDPEAADRSDQFQAALLQQWPWVSEALADGASVVYVIEEE